MLNIGGLKEGVVIDHIKAGGAMEIYNYLGLENLDCSVAIIKNAKSNKMGKKDIIKITLNGRSCAKKSIKNWKRRISNRWTFVKNSMHGM